MKSVVLNLLMAACFLAAVNGAGRGLKQPGAPDDPRWVDFMKQFDLPDSDDEEEELLEELEDIDKWNNDTSDDPDVKYGLNEYSSKSDAWKQKNLFGAVSSAAPTVSELPPKNDADANNGRRRRSIRKKREAYYTQTSCGTGANAEGVPFKNCNTCVLEYTDDGTKELQKKCFPNNDNTLDTKPIIREMATSKPLYSSNSANNYNTVPTLTVSAADSVAFPGAVLDWRGKGYLTPMKNQKNCGSCYTFASSAVFESRLAIKTQTQPQPWAEQQMIDCGTGIGINKGCNGGCLPDTVKYFQQSKAYAKSEDYPYAEKENGGCAFDSSKGVAVSFTGSYSIYGVDQPSANNHVLQSSMEQRMIDALQYGPVYISVHASTPKFTAYKEGVFDEKECPTNPNHAVVLVGYGKDPNTGEDYWIIRNSWGTTWGQNGYGKIRKGQNRCGIETNIAFPYFG